MGEGCKRDWPECQGSAELQGGQMERWPLPGAALGTQGWQLCCCVLVTVLVQDRLALEPAERQRGAHHILPAWQGARHKQGAQSLGMGQCWLCKHQTVPGWVNARKTWLKQVPLLSSSLPPHRTRPLLHSTKEYYISTLSTEEASTYQLGMGHWYHENMEKFFYLHV